MNHLAVVLPSLFGLHITTSTIIVLLLHQQQPRPAPPSPHLSVCLSAQLGSPWRRGMLTSDRLQIQTSGFYPEGRHCYRHHVRGAEIHQEAQQARDSGGGPAERVGGCEEHRGARGESDPLQLTRTPAGPVSVLAPLRSGSLGDNTTFQPKRTGSKSLCWCLMWFCQRLSPSHRPRCEALTAGFMLTSAGQQLEEDGDVPVFSSCFPPCCQLAAGVQQRDLIHMWFSLVSWVSFCWSAAWLPAARTPPFGWKHHVQLRRAHSAVESGRWL